MFEHRGRCRAPQDWSLCGPTMHTDALHTAWTLSLSNMDCPNENAALNGRAKRTRRLSLGIPHNAGFFQGTWELHHTLYCVL